MKLKLNYLLIAIFAIIFSPNTYGKEIVKPKPLPLSNFNNTQSGFGDFIKKIGNLFKPEWGCYIVKGQNNSSPLAMFNRTTFAKDTAEIIQKIKVPMSDFYKIYENVFSIGSNIGAFTIPAKNGSRNVFENRSTYAKNAAFVLVLGIYENGSRISKDTLNRLADNVLKVIKECDDNITDNWFQKEGLTGWGEDAQMIRSIELINYCIALDMVRTAGYTWNNTQQDQSNPCTALKEFTFRLFKYSNRPFNSLSNILNNNISILVGSALVYAGIILHSEKDMLLNWRHHPRVWAKVGHIRIRESEFTAINHSQSKKGGKHGHQEGPGYYAKCMKEGVIPVSIAFDNFVDNNKNYEKVYFSAEDLLYYLVGGPTGALIALIALSERVHNYQSDPDWKNTLYWYRDIQQPNGHSPSFDDTRISSSLPTMACFKDPKLSLLSGLTLMNSFNNVYNERADFLAANNPAIPFERSVNFANSLSGDAVFRTQINTKSPNSTLANDQHYIYINSKESTNPLEYARQVIFGKTQHQHPSAGNLIINAGNEILLLDPPYYGEANQSNVNSGTHHNVISVGDNPQIGPSNRDQPQLVNFDAYANSITIKTKYRGPNPNVEVKRTVQVYDFKDSGDVTRYYYEVIDDFKVDPVFGYAMEGKTFKLNLNGNGNVSEGTCNDSRKQFGEVVWKHPCIARGTWKLYARTSLTSSDNGSLSFNITGGHLHGNANFEEALKLNSTSIDNRMATGAILGNDGYSTHSRFTASIYGEKGVFQTIFIPLRCDEPDFPIDTFWVKIKSDSFYSISTLKNIGKDHISNIHLKKGYSNTDTISVLNSLFNNDLSQLSNIKFIGDRALFSISMDSVFRRKNCVSYTKFRKASVDYGFYLAYNDTVYIKANKFVNANYSIIAPSKYSGQVKTDSSCTVNLYLAGMERGVGMKVEGLNYTYDTGTCIISIDVPIGLTQFEIELEDPCRVSCFFPSTAETINGQFDFSEGITQTLGHKLSIVKPNGFLNITNGSHMMLCDGIYLHNRDSLVLYSGCGKDTGQVSISTCNGAVNGTPFGAMSGAGGGAKPSMLSVKAGAALILEDSSFTQISNNSELHVWGTLVIKKGAKLLIGDGRTCAYATIMVYPGANLHIEDDAHLEFFKIIGDTQDRHIFFIANKPYGASVQKGVASNILTLLQNDTIISNANIPVEICDLYTVTPTHGIANRDWGFSNVLAPKALIKIPNDTICEGECLMIDFKSSLNDPIREIEVCRIDTFLGNASLSCFGSWRIEGNSLEAGYNENTKCYSSQTQLSYFPLCDYIDSTNHWYKIFVKVKNHCDFQDTQTLYFYIAHKPNAIIAVADSACPGYETVKAHNLSNFNAEKAMWHVQLLDSTQY